MIHTILFLLFFMKIKLHLHEKKDVSQKLEKRLILRGLHQSLSTHHNMVVLRWSETTISLISPTKI